VRGVILGDLTDCGVTVSPNADLTGTRPTPDFFCIKEDSKFYVEVTCIRAQTATNKTSLESIPRSAHAASNYESLNSAICGECVNKTPQCANLDAPCLLAIGTFHFQASVLGVQRMFMEWLLTGEPIIAFSYAPRLGHIVGELHQATRFRSATFTRYSKLEGIEHARRPISALLVAGLGCDPAHIFGLLHPSPSREFNPALLHRIPFCRQKIDIGTGTVSTKWMQTPTNWMTDVDND
jgi:hypothetical protein